MLGASDTHNPEQLMFRIRTVVTLTATGEVVKSTFGTVTFSLTNVRFLAAKTLSVAFTRVFYNA